MRCYICGNRTEVIKTVDRDGGGKVLRKRRCVVHHEHVMDTMEQFLPPSLDDVGVRQSGSGQLSRERFSKERLEGDVAQSILRGVGRDKEPHDLAERVTLNAIRRLEAQLIEIASPISSEERQQHPGMKVAIPDSAIANAVEAELRHMALRMPRALYALSIRGRQDREGRDGWSTAEDALRWIYANYPKLNRSNPLAPPTPPTFTWSPSRKASRPHWVIKRSRPRPARFDEAQFVGGIRRAMLGRKDADMRSRLVAEWVLHGIEGQQSVLTSQLGVGVLDALRRVDDIAYLRWTTIFKGLTGVTELAEEAYALVESPSARLVFGSSQIVPIDRGSTLI